MKHFYVIAVIFLVCITCFNVVNGGSECGRKCPEQEALKLASCIMAAQNQNAPVSDSCCAAIKQIGLNPTCLCAVMLSKTAQSTGAKSEVAITIPKRCNIADRPVGYKCDAYIVP